MGDVRTECAEEFLLVDLLDFERRSFLGRVLGSGARARFLKNLFGVAECWVGFAVCELVPEPTCFSS